MAYFIKVQPDESIIWETWVNYDPRIDGESSTRDELDILDAASSPLVLIVDLRQGKLHWNDILYITRHGLPRELHDHPRLRRIIAISTSDLVEEVAQGMENGAVFDLVKVDLVASPHEALERARQLLV